jgi:hypothetical protein
MSSLFHLFKQPKTLRNPFPNKTPAGTTHNIFMVILGLLVVVFGRNTNPLAKPSSSPVAHNVLAICLIANTLFFGFVVRQITIGNRVGGATTYLGKKAMVASLFWLFIETSLIFVSSN